MLFNSIDFAIFLPIVFVLYWFVTNKNLRLQNILIVSASFLFYGWWDWRFLLLLIGSIIVDYLVGLGLANQENSAKRKLFLWISIIAQIGLLGFFKYYNFFLASFIDAFTFFGADISANSLNIILPVGISFYTFQTLSYTIDVYRRKFAPTRDFIAFAAFVSFFPQLVAGPIERAANLLPQFYRSRTFDYAKATDGLRQMLWGLFKKIVIADNCAVYADMIFNNSANYSGSTLVLGALFFTFQIYGDFSGYSDIAIGTARLFGFDLMRNFAFPYFSRDIAEFWRRWHISLSTWFRDYVYIPLGGSRGSTWTKVRNILIVFLVSGLWHGANWTFVVWGALHATYFLPLLLLGKNRDHLDTVAPGKLLPSLKEVWAVSATFWLTVFAWIFFRAQNMHHALSFISQIFSKSLLTVPDFPMRLKALVVLVLVVGFLIVEWVGRGQQHALANLGGSLSRPLRWSVYLFIILIIIMYMAALGSPFIYFQF
ncbi:MAG: MBOAT family O-acyltransferase [Patescibacteria group bacterium]|jgi:D-alanyl-lipoteichoic acid acyltransferase DltB (MBOAT superfamily)